MYFGASLETLKILAEKKGYVFIGCNSNGNDAFFIRADLAAKLQNFINTAHFVEAKARESRDIKGRLTYIRGDERINEIKNMEVIDVKTNKISKLKNLY